MIMLWLVASGWLALCYYRTRPRPRPRSFIIAVNPTLFVSRGGGCHALTCIAVAVKHPHAELRQRAEERHFLGTDLARTEPRNRIVAVFVLNGFQAQREDLQRRVPVGRLELAIRIAQVRCRCAVRRT